MRSTVRLGLFFVAIVVVLLAQGETTGGETGRILSLESAWNQAEVQHDARAMSMLLAETFEYTDSDGRFMDKSHWLNLVTKGVDQYDQLGNSGIEVHLYGDVAIVTGAYRERIKSKRNAVVRAGRFTDIWLQQNGQWKCIASQATLMSH
jgi:ketosteroid isomerase-like protein